MFVTKHANQFRTGSKKNSFYYYFEICFFLLKRLRVSNYKTLKSNKELHATYDRVRGSPSDKVLSKETEVFLKFYGRTMFFLNPLEKSFKEL